MFITEKERNTAKEDETGKKTEEINGKRRVVIGQKTKRFVIKKKG